jgi:hypothetical protein
MKEDELDLLERELSQKERDITNLKDLIQSKKSQLSDLKRA